MGDSIEDLKNVVAQTLETKGVLAQIRAELRKHVFLAIEEQENTSNPSHLANPKITQIQATPTDHLVLDLVREFCDFYGLDHTLSVMQAEAKLSSRPRSRKLLADSLHLPIVGTHPLLYDIIQRDHDHGEEKNKRNVDDEKKMEDKKITSTSTPSPSVAATTSSFTTSTTTPTAASTTTSTTSTVTSTTSTTTSTSMPSLAPLAKKPLGGLSPLPSLMPTSSTSSSTSSPSLLSSTTSSSTSTSTSTTSSSTSSSSSTSANSNVPSMPTHPPPILSPTSANKPKKTVRFDASRDEAQEAPPIPSEDEESMDDIKPSNDRRKPVDVSSVTASLQTQAAQASTTMSTLTSTSMTSTSSTSSSLSGTSLTSLGRLGGPLPKLGPLPTITKQPLPSMTSTHDDDKLEDSAELDAADQKRLEEIEQKLKKLDEQDKGLKQQVTTDDDEYGEDFAMEEEVGEEIDIDISTGEAEEEHGQQRQVLDNSGDFSAGEDSYDQNFNDPKQNTQSYTDTSDVYSQDASVHDSFEESFDYVEPVEPI